MKILRTGLAATDGKILRVTSSFERLGQAEINPIESTRLRMLASTGETIKRHEN